MRHRRRLLPAVITGLSLAVAPVIVGLAVLVLGATGDPGPTPVPTIDVAPQPSSDQATPTPDGSAQDGSAQDGSAQDGSAQDGSAQVSPPR